MLTEIGALLEDQGVDVKKVKAVCGHGAAKARDPIVLCFASVLPRTQDTAREAERGSLFAKSRCRAAPHPNCGPSRLNRYFKVLSVGQPPP